MAAWTNLKKWIYAKNSVTMASWPADDFEVHRIFGSLVLPSLSMWKARLSLQGGNVFLAYWKLFLYVGFVCLFCNSVCKISWNSCYMSDSADKDRLVSHTISTTWEFNSARKDSLCLKMHSMLQREVALRKEAWPSTLKNESRSLFLGTIGLEDTES